MLQQSKKNFIHFEMHWEMPYKSTNYTKVCAIHHIHVYTTLHKTILGFADISSMEKFFDFFCITPHTRKIKKKVQSSFIHLKTY